MKNITLQELKAHQDNLKKGIDDLINDFYDKTGVWPTVSISTIHANAMGNRSYFLETEVTTNIISGFEP